MSIFEQALQELEQKAYTVRMVRLAKDLDNTEGHEPDREELADRIEDLAEVMEYLVQGKIYEVTRARKVRDQLREAANAPIELD